MLKKGREVAPDNAKVQEGLQRVEKMADAGTH